MTQNYLRALSSFGYSVHLISRQFSLSNSDVGKFKLEKVLAIPGLLVRASKSFICKRPDYFIAFISSSTYGFLADYLIIGLARILRIRVILYLHTVGFDQLRRKNRFFSSLVTKCFKSAERAVVLSSAMVADIEAIIPKSRISIIPNMTNFSLGVSELKKPHQSVHQVLYLSNLIPSKGVLDFLEMARLIASQRSDCIFIIAGSSVDLEFDKKVQSKIKSLKDECEIIVVGSVNESQKLKLYRESTLLVFPSYYPKEAQPMVVIEAFSLGLPVVAYDHGGISDLIGDRRCVANVGDIHSLAFKVNSLLDSKETMSSVKAGVRERFEAKYSVSSYASNWANFFEALGN